MDIAQPIKHLAIIPDGNRRWAKAKGLPVIAGHSYASEKVLPKLVDKAYELGIKYFTFWALSTENILKRDRNELNSLFNLIEVYTKTRLGDFQKKGYRFLTIGDLTKLPNSIQTNLQRAVENTKNNTKLNVILALNYGGRDEILRAIKKIDSQQNLTQDSFSQYLDTKDIPNPDLIIRTGGEQRLSGFMIWQSVYSELIFSQKFFPDFNGQDLEEAMTEFNSRQRRFGK